MSQNTIPRIRLTLAQRRVLFFSQLVVLSGYLIINRVMTQLGGGATFDIWLDHYVPLWPIWAVPYSLALVWWVIAVLWAYWKMEDTLYTAFVIAWVTTCLIGYGVFILYPNYMVRPQVVGAGLTDWFIHFIYAVDRTYNAFPSMHVWLTVLITLFWGRWKPGWSRALWAFTLIVGLSTLFTGQHWIMDVIGGTLLAIAGYLLAWAGVARLSHVFPLRPRPVSADELVSES
jgi:membrane-associated phospholipid phosphatase